MCKELPRTMIPETTSKGDEQDNKKRMMDVVFNRLSYQIRGKKRPKGQAEMKISQGGVRRCTAEESPKTT
jgi:hypothetical protein